jgi:hypothetical protein
MGSDPVSGTRLAAKFKGYGAPIRPCKHNELRVSKVRAKRGDGWVRAYRGLHKDSCKSGHMTQMELQ